MKIYFTKHLIILHTRDAYGCFVYPVSWPGIWLAWLLPRVLTLVPFLQRSNFLIKRSMGTFILWVMFKVDISWVSQGEFCKGTLSPGIGLAVTGKTGVAGQSGFLGRRNFSMVCIYLVGLGPDVHSVFLVVALALFVVCGGSLLFGCCRKSLVNVVCLLGIIV